VLLLLLLLLFGHLSWRMGICMPYEMPYVIRRYV